MSMMFLVSPIDIEYGDWSRVKAFGSYESAYAYGESLGVEYCISDETIY